MENERFNPEHEGHKPLFEELDMTDTWDEPSMLEKITTRLKELGLYDENLIFRGIGQGELESVRKKGVDKTKNFFATTESEMLNPISENSALKYALDYPEPAVLVYDGSKFEKVSDYGYELLEGESYLGSLKAVFALKMP